MANLDVPMRERVKAFLLRHPQLGRVGFAAVERLKSNRSTTRSSFTMEGLLLHLSKQGFAASTCLDVGANRAEWCRHVRAVFPEANLYLLEPQEEMASTLDAYCERTSKARWKQAGAGAEAGTMELTIWPDFAGSTFVDAPEIRSDLERRDVPIVTLDGLVEEGWMPSPDLVKIDVQGFELEVLRGASTLLGRTDVFILETAFFPFFSGAPVFTEVLEFMNDHGYALYDFGGALRRPLDGALASVDAVFVRANGRFRTSNAWG